MGFPYLVGPPGVGLGSSVSASASSGAKKKAPEAQTGAADAAAAAQARPRRRRRAQLRGYGHEFMDLNVQVEPDWGGPAVEHPVTPVLASDHGARSLGSAGTVRTEAAAATGLATLAGDGFGGGPATPMMPRAWQPDQQERGEREAPS